MRHDKYDKRVVAVPMGHCMNGMYLRAGTYQGVRVVVNSEREKREEGCSPHFHGQEPDLLHLAFGKWAVSQEDGFGQWLVQ